MTNTFIFREFFCQISTFVSLKPKSQDMARNLDKHNLQQLFGNMILYTYIPVSSFPILQKHHYRCALVCITVLNANSDKSWPENQRTLTPANKEKSDGELLLFYILLGWNQYMSNPPLPPPPPDYAHIPHSPPLHISEWTRRGEGKCQQTRWRKLKSTKGVGYDCWVHFLVGLAEYSFGTIKHYTGVLTVDWSSPYIII